MKLNRKKIIMTILVAGLVASGSIGNAQQGAHNKKNISTKQIIDRTADELMSCTDYCIVGMELRVYWTWRGPRFYRTLVAEHNMPDLLVMTANKEADMPWDLYRNTFSSIVTKAADSTLQATLGMKEFGGGRSQSKGFGQTQAISFKEADIMGNPSLFIFSLLGSNIPNDRFFNEKEGTVLYDKANPNNIRKNYNSSWSWDWWGNGREKLPSWQANNVFNRDMERMVTAMQKGQNFIPKSFVQAMGGGAIKNYSRAHPKAWVWRNTVRAFVSALGAGAKIDRYTCNASTEPLKPYYVSIFDSLQWRAGYPVTDPHKSKIILNPLGNDWIKPTDTAMLAKADSLGINTSNIPYGWGRIYPRTGFVNHQDDYKVAGVTAARALSVASDKDAGKGAGRIGAFAGAGTGKVMWQQLHPVGGSCHYNMTNSINGADANLAGNYAWNGWRRTKCSLRTRGSKVMSIPFPRVCLKSVTGGGGVRQ